MFPGYLLALREGLEAALIIGIVLGILNKLRSNHLKPAVWWGVLLAIAVSLLGAVGLIAVGAKLEGRSEEIFEGIAMLTAAVVLTWMIFWMRRQAGGLSGKLESDVRLAATRSGFGALFLLAFLAVGREGLELALFLVATGMVVGNSPTLVGAGIGLATAVLIGWLVFRSTSRLNIKLFFQITSLLLILFAAGLVAHGIHEFNEAGIVPAVVDPVWDINGFFSETSIPGEMMKALFGYNGNPSLTEVVAYLVYFLVLFTFFWSQRDRVEAIQQV